MAFKLIANKNKHPAHPQHPLCGEHRYPYRIPTPAHGRSPMKKKLMLVAGSVAVLLLAGCGGHVDSPPVPDLVPIGDGLKVVAYAVVAAAVIIVLGKLLP